MLKVKSRRGACKVYTSLPIDKIRLSKAPLKMPWESVGKIVTTNPQWTYSRTWLLTVGSQYIFAVFSFFIFQVSFVLFLSKQVVEQGPLPKYSLCQVGHRPVHFSLRCALFISLYLSVSPPRCYHGADSLCFVSPNSPHFGFFEITVCCLLDSQSHFFLLPAYYERGNQDESRWRITGHTNFHYQNSVLFHFFFSVPAALRWMALPHAPILNYNFLNSLLWHTLLQPFEKLNYSLPFVLPYLLFCQHFQRTIASKTDFLPL